jgi:hypothetical protein
VIAGMRQAGSYVLCYALWLVSSAIGVADVLSGRTFVEWAYVALRLDKWGMAAAVQSGLVIFGLLWLVFVIWAEQRYRDAVPKGGLWWLFLRITWIQVLLMVPGFLPLAGRRLLSPF